MPKFRDGSGVWEQLVRPSVVDLERVLAHHAISLIYQPIGQDSRQRALSFDVETLEQEVRARGRGHLALGRLRVRSRRTWNEAEARFVVIHYGELDFHAVLNLDTELGTDDFASLKPGLLETYRTGSLADITGLVAQAEFPGRSHRLDDLFRDEQRRIIGIVLEDRFLDYQRSFELLANQDEQILNRLGQLGYPIPKPLRAAASGPISTFTWLRRSAGWPVAKSPRWMRSITSASGDLPGVISQNAGCWKRRSLNRWCARWRRSGLTPALRS